MKMVNSFLLNLYKIVVVVVFLLIGSTFAQTVTYDSLPSDYQLYPRNEADNDSASVTILGMVDDVAATYDSIIVEIDTNSVLWRRHAQLLTYVGNTANFLLTPNIYADTIEFTFEILFREGTNPPVQNTVIENVVCGDVFLIEGQSNAEATAPFPNFQPYEVEWVRTFGTMTDKDGDVKSGDPTAEDTSWGLAQAVWPNDPTLSGSYYLNVGIIGLRLGKLIVDNYGIPVCIINGAAGGTRIKEHVRDFPDPYSLDTIYGRFLYRVTKAGLINNVKALIWWQGEGNTLDLGVAEDYFDTFPSIRNDWRLDFNPLDKIYTVQLHVGGGATSQMGALYAHHLREFQRILALNDADTEIMSANDISGFAPDSTHFTTPGYDTVAYRIFRQIRRDFYNYSNNTDIDPPNISQAYFTNAQKKVLILEFDNTNTLVWQNDTTIKGHLRLMKDYFYLHNDAGGGIDSFVVDNAQVFGNLLRLELNASSNADSVTYLPISYYNRESNRWDALYEGPWLRNSKGVPALSFYRFEINSGFGDDVLPVSLSSFTANYFENKVIINWHTASEVNNLGFIILRKQEGEEDYQTIASYENKPALEGQGTVTQPTDYFFEDTNILENKTYYYLLQDVSYNGEKTNHGPVQVMTTETSVPEGFNLYQNYPNPFNPNTLIKYQIPQEGRVVLSIYNVLGEEIQILVDKNLPPGIYNIRWDGTDNKGNIVGSGFYFCQLSFFGKKKFTQNIKMIFMN